MRFRFWYIDVVVEHFDWSSIRLISKCVNILSKPTEPKVSSVPVQRDADARYRQNAPPPHPTKNPGSAPGKPMLTIIWILAILQNRLFFRFRIRSPSALWTLYNNSPEKAAIGIKRSFWAQCVAKFLIFFCCFFKVFVGHIHMSFLGATGTPVSDFWWHLLWVSKPEWAALFTEANVMYVPWDPPLVLHLLTSWQLAWLPVLSTHTVASRGEVAGIRTLALRICVSQTLYQLN